MASQPNVLADKKSNEFSSAPYSMAHKPKPQLKNKSTMTIEQLGPVPSVKPAFQVHGTKEFEKTT